MNNVQEFGIEELDIEQLDEYIRLLCSRRASVLYSMGVEERYFVYDNKNDMVSNDAWVLSARSDTDKRGLVEIAESGIYDDFWNKKILSWLEQKELDASLDVEEDIDD